MGKLKHAEWIKKVVSELKCEDRTHFLQETLCRLEAADREIERAGRRFQTVLDVNKRQLKRIADLEELLRDYGRHNHGCPGDVGSTCKCGWEKIKDKSK